MKNTLPHQFTEGQVYSVRLPDSAYIEEWTVTKREKKGAGWQTWLTLRDDSGNILRRSVQDDGEREYVELHKQFYESWDHKRFSNTVYLTAGIHTINQ